MINELRKEIDAGNVSFGQRQILKNSKKIERAFVSKDCRDEVMNVLEDNKISFDVLDLTKEEIANQLEIGFRCEIFGLRK